MRKTIFTRLIHSFKSSNMPQRVYRRLARGVRLGAAVGVIAGGMTFAGVAQATQVLNEGFEGASPGIWDNGFGTYGTGQNYSNSPHGSLPGGGAFYGHLIGITDTITSTTVDFASTLTGAELTAISEGRAQWNFDGWLASYTADADITVFSIELFDGANGTGNSLGTFTMADGSQFTAADGVTQYIDSGGVVQAGDAGADEENWKHYVTSGGIIPTAASANIIYDGQTSGASNTNDAYADNIMVDIVSTPNEQFVKLVVNKTTGTLRIENNTANSVDLNFYEITSTSGLLSTSWNSFSDQNLDPVDGPDPNSVAGDGEGETWDEGGGISTTLLTEAFLLGSTTFASGGGSESLTGGYTGGDLGAEDLVFKYGLTDDTLLPGVIVYETGGANADFDLSGVVDGLDFLLWQTGGSPNPLSQSDLALWEAQYGMSFPLSGAVAAVPEPGSILLCGLGLLTLTRTRRRDS